MISQNVNEDTINTLLKKVVNSNFNEVEMNDFMKDVEKKYDLEQIKCFTEMLRRIGEEAHQKCAVEKMPLEDYLYMRKLVNIH